MRVIFLRSNLSWTIRTSGLSRRISVTERRFTPSLRRSIPISWSTLRRRAMWTAPSRILPSSSKPTSWEPPFSWMPAVNMALPVIIRFPPMRCTAICRSTDPTSSLPRRPLSTPALPTARPRRALICWCWRITEPTVCRSPSAAAPTTTVPTISRRSSFR